MVIKYTQYLISPETGIWNSTITTYYMNFRKIMEGGIFGSCNYKAFNFRVLVDRFGSSSNTQDN